MGVGLFNAVKSPHTQRKIRNYSQIRLCNAIVPDHSEPNQHTNHRDTDIFGQNTRQTRVSGLMCLLCTQILLSSALLEPKRLS